ncbi:MAG: DsbA family protein [Methylovirgula sp.]|nr:DsbA family protein [Methylovirgula sp.]
MSGWLAAGLSPAAADDKVTIPLEKLYAPQALPDIVQGKADAPITIVEYASMTCPHCARFHSETYPALLSKYIDTGKARFILREFPLDPRAAAAFMLARCAGDGDKRTGVVDLLFNSQMTWAESDKPLDTLADLMRQTGMSAKDFDACLNNQKLYSDVIKERDDAGKDFGIDATPTFFINGVKYSGELSIDALSKIIDPLIAKK